MNTSKLPRVAGAALAALVLSTPAHAIFRAYLASDGSDANPCTLLQPCRLLPAALAAVDAGGEIWMLDSANYNTGEVNIAKSVSILAIPGALGSIVATGAPTANGLSITTAGLRVSLRNLVIVQLGAGNFGVRLAANSELSLRDCEIANHPGMGGGIHASGNTAGLVVKDSIIRNSNTGVLLESGVTGTFDRVRFENNSVGVYSSNSRLSIANSLVTGNQYGIAVYAGFGNVSRAAIDRTGINRNGYGLSVESFVTNDLAWATLSNSVVSYNGTAGIRAIQVGGFSRTSLDNVQLTHNGTPIDVVGTPTIHTRNNNTVQGNGSGDVITPLVTPISAQ